MSSYCPSAKTKGYAKMVIVSKVVRMSTYLKVDKKIIGTRREQVRDDEMSCVLHLPCILRVVS